MDKDRNLTSVDDDDDNERVIEIVSDDAFATAAAPAEHIVIQADPFEATADELRKMDGVSTALKRKTTRELQKFQRGDGAKSKRMEHFETLSAYSQFNVALPNNNLEYLAKIYEISSPHKSAVDAKVANIVGLGYEWTETLKTQQALSRKTDETGIERAYNKIETMKQTLDLWLEDLNEEDTFEEIMHKVWTDVETTGNGYLEIGRRVDGRVGYLGHVPSTSMRVRLNRDGFVQIMGNKATFFRNFGDSKTADPVGNDRRPNEIIHFKKYSPNDSYYGVPDIVSAASSLAGNEFASRYNLDYFEHKAVPRYIITVKGAKLSPASERRLIEFFQNGVKGKNHRSLYVPLPSDGDGEKVEFKMEPVEASIQDASFINFHKMNRDDILMSHRVPISKVGLAEGVSLAVARDADKTFKEQVCRPSQKIFDKKFNRLIDEMTDVVDFKLKELTLTDEDTESKIIERLVRMQVLTPNEGRHRIGMKGRKGGDKPWEAKPQEAAEQTAQATGNRQRDQERQSNSPDGDGEARQPQGEGRAVE